MNILFFLTPKSEVAYIDDTCYIRQALEKMKHYGYTAIPIINAEGKYIGTATEGDFLWMFLEQREMSLNDIEHMRVKDMKRRTINEPVSINADITDLITTAMKQNFVPVIDDDNVFIGIVTRKDILQYCHEKMFK
ncbi:CBS domain-containing protein [Velocimicrobium porci]|uniref:CBS domain-containing protein n=1 Tax=Velocimicrobium porci TaxID=2606634 RepID=A0A6L5XXR9_9FIRM|nr:CBS domain-containing protein [Velocimicrobium porci]MSS62773.1 CBS domain-containing protein [Velocimicrobium porci]